MPKVRTQADRRKHAMFIDQHGRKWFAVIEKDTMHPCGALTPHGWTEAPGCRVPDQYKHLLHEEDPFRLTIAYDPWIADLEAAREDYDNRCATSAAFMSPDNAGALLFRIKDDGTRFYHPTLVKYVGPLPAPVELARAQRAGNKWALGLVNPETGKPYPMPKWAEPFLPKPEKARAEEALEFPDVEDETEEVDDFEDVLTPAQLAEIKRDAVQFPDEPEGRLDEESEALEEIPTGDDEEGDVFTELATVGAGSSSESTQEQKQEPKPSRRGATTKNKG